MNHSKFAKHVLPFESGLISAPEAANALLFGLLIQRDIESEFPPLVESLPEEIQRELRCLLLRIEAGDFHWTPFLLDSTDHAPDSSKYVAILRKVCDLMRRLDRNCVEPPMKYC